MVIFTEPFSSPDVPGIINAIVETTMSAKQTNQKHVLTMIKSTNTFIDRTVSKIGPHADFH
jgi:hypothetical protein